MFQPIFVLLENFSFQGLSKDIPIIELLSLMIFTDVNFFYRFQQAQDGEDFSNYSMLGF